MPSFLSAIQALAGNSNMENVNYIDISENHKEFIRKDTWELNFTKKPAAVYYPGDEIVKSRCTTVSPSLPTSIAGIQHNIRGFQINQKTSRNTAGTVNLTFVDREDQAITVMCDDWRNKISDNDNKYSFRKEDTIADLRYSMMNSSRFGIRDIIMLTCQPNDIGLQEEGDSEPEQSSSNSEVTLGLDFEHSKRIYNNL
jgi:hypothetical protein